MSPKETHCTAWNIITRIVVARIITEGKMYFNAVICIFVCRSSPSQGQPYIYLSSHTVKPRGRPQKPYLQVIQTQLKKKHIKTLEEAMIKVKDRESWRAIVQDPSFTKVYE